MTIYIYIYIYILYIYIYVCIQFPVMQLKCISHFKYIVTTIASPNQCKLEFTVTHYSKTGSEDSIYRSCYSFPSSQLPDDVQTRIMLIGWYGVTLLISEAHGRVGLKLIDTDWCHESGWAGMPCVPGQHWCFICSLLH